MSSAVQSAALQPQRDLDRHSGPGLDARRVAPGADARNMLANAALYTCFQRAVRGSCDFVYVAKHVKPQPDDRILDIGCGTGDILRHMPRVEYIGFDVSERLIKRARRVYGDRGQFYCKDLNDKSCRELGEFDIVIATGVVHHLDDDEALRLFELSRSVLRPGGRLVTLDGCYTETQSRVARRILSMDRGRFVRTEAEYRRLASQQFGHVESTVYDKLLRIPSSIVIMECRD